MRIGQLARRLGIPPTEVLGFLSTQNIEAEGGANSRLSNEIVTKVINRFAPEKLSEILTVPPEAVVEAVVNESIAEPVAELPKIAEEKSEETVDEALRSETDATSQGPVEVIRVAKVELQGLKVLGKIELPDPKKKQEVVTPETIEEQPAPETQQSTETQPAQQTQSARSPRKEFQRRNNNRREQRDWKNPIEAKREQEAQEAERKRQEQAERLKEKRTNHYYNKVKSVPTKAVRRIDEQTVVEDIDVKETPKGLFAKFFHWLRN